MAHHFYLDASALAKRYAPEPGTAVINHLFARLTPARMFVLHIGVAEVVSILVRKRNAGKLSRTAFTQAFVDLQAEIINQLALRKLDADATFVAAALPVILKHSINSTDAILLCSALDVAVSLSARGNDLVLIAADQRLLRAARTEGLLTFNPETQTTADLNALLI